jgi:hypothetical protein
VLVEESYTSETDSGLVGEDSTDEQSMIVKVIECMAVTAESLLWVHVTSTVPEKPESSDIDMS